jgi:hypothetical protein
MDYVLCEVETCLVYNFDEVRLQNGKNFSHYIFFSLVVKCILLSPVYHTMKEKIFEYTVQWQQVKFLFISVISSKFQQALAFRHKLEHIEGFIMKGHNRWSFSCSHHERALVPINRRLGWAPEPVWTFCKRGKSHVPTRIQTPDHPAHSIDAMPTTLLWLQKKELQPVHIVYIFCYQFIWCSLCYSMNCVIQWLICVWFSAYTPC